MARNYRRISEYEEAILRLKSEGWTKREIGEKYGFTFEQVHNFISRYNEKQRKIAAGITIKKKGRQPKDYQVSEEDNLFSCHCSCCVAGETYPPAHRRLANN